MRFRCDWCCCNRLFFFLLFCFRRFCLILHTLSRSSFDCLIFFYFSLYVLFCSFLFFQLFHSLSIFFQFLSLFPRYSSCWFLLLTIYFFNVFNSVRFYKAWQLHMQLSIILMSSVKIRTSKT